MRVPISWLKEFVDIHIPLVDLAHQMTLAGLEVEEIQIVGWPMPEMQLHEFKVTGLSWDPDKIVVGSVLEVMPHPNADRLVLCRLDDGEKEHVVLTGAPNLYPYKGLGVLEKPLRVPYAKEGAAIYDGHQPGQVLTTLKRAKIRGVESYSMICSEKELGVSDEHEGVIILDGDAPVGAPLADYMGDAVFDIAITPNIARDANILGVAREVSAITGVELRRPSYDVLMQGPSIIGQVDIIIQEPELNPRFVLGLIRNVKIGESPYWVQRRLRLAGMRPINNIVDATNYAMWEIGEPLHAFDYDVLVQRAGGKAPNIITRRARPGERLTTLDGLDRELDEFTELVCDTAGALSIAGVMGGAESEVSERTRNVLLEAATWNFINIRRTVNAQRLPSEASYRFSRSVHPAMAERGLRRCLEYMRQWSGGVVDQGLVDNYPLPPAPVVVEVTTADIKRWLGISLSAQEAARILQRLEFSVKLVGDKVIATAPDYRLDIGEDVIGMADIMEEIARIYGYDRIPETRMADELPPQKGNAELEKEEQLRDLLARLGLQEVINYRMTSPEYEARLYKPDADYDQPAYVRLENPLSPERRVLRQSLLSSVMEVVERNARLRERQALFEIGPIFLPDPYGELPLEMSRLALVMIGPRSLSSWQGSDTTPMDFYDLKGVLEAVFEDLHLDAVAFTPGDHPSYHPGKCARIQAVGRDLGVMGELHPQVRSAYDLPITYERFPLLAAELDIQALMENIPQRYLLTPVPSFPPVLEDLAVILDEDVPGIKVEEIIRQAGGKLVAAVRLFDIFRGEQIGEGKKSLAYRLTYQAPDRTLTDAEVAQLRQRIIRRLEAELGAKLRS